MQNLSQTLQNKYETSDDIMGKIQQLTVNTNKNNEEVAHDIHQFAFWKRNFWRKLKFCFTSL